MTTALHTKGDFQVLLHRILDPVKPFYSPGGALLELGRTGTTYPGRVALLEAFARPLWGLAPYWAGGGADADFAAIYPRGLASGTDPAHPEYWGPCGQCDQRFVEMAALGFAILLAPERVWEPMAAAERDRLAGWLREINRREYPDNNWWFFSVLVNLALKSRGQAHDGPWMEQALARMEDFYLGDGWYQDGLTDRKDYYVSFAIHFYSLIYAVVMREADPDRSRTYIRRAGLFARDFLYWFDEDGAALPYGRSLTYRFAQAAFWSACVYAGVDTVELGVIKGVIARHLRDWLSSPIFDRDGVLTIGYRYPNLHMAEVYNAPGSPYWGLKAFLVLALPDGHPFWSVKACPLPALKPLKKLARADMLVQRLPRHTVAYPSGSYQWAALAQFSEKYGKFAYSTRFGFSVACGAEDIGLAAPDSMLAFVVDGHVLVRRQSEAFEIHEDRVCSRWSPCRGISVETTLTPGPNGHTRRHVVTSEFDCFAYDCGFAVADDASAAFRAGSGPDSALVENAAGRCAVARLQGQGAGEVIPAAPNTSLMYPRTRIPALRYAIPRGKTILETDVVAEIYPG